MLYNSESKDITETTKLLGQEQGAGENQFFATKPKCLIRGKTVTQIIQENLVPREMLKKRLIPSQTLQEDWYPKVLHNRLVPCETLQERLVP